MDRFVTIADAPPASLPVLVWEEVAGAAPRVVSRHGSLEDVPDAGGMEIHRFNVPTTLQVGKPINPTNYPVVDADGAPLWEGARIRFTIPDYYINTNSGEGSYVSARPYGGNRIVTDEPLPVRIDRNGSYRERSRERDVALSEYVRSGPLKGFLMLSGKLGDPFEHGTTKTFVRVIDDPRKVCEPVTAPGPTP